MKSTRRLLVISKNAISRNRITLELVICCDLMPGTSSIRVSGQWSELGDRVFISKLDS